MQERRNSNADALSRNPSLPAPPVGIAEDEVQVANLTSDSISRVSGVLLSSGAVSGVPLTENNPLQNVEAMQGPSNVNVLAELPFFSQEDKATTNQQFLQLARLHWHQTKWLR